MSNAEDYLALPQILSRLMADKGLKERDLVKATGLPQTTVNNILRGISKHPRHATLKTIARVFDMSLTQLMAYKGPVSALPTEDTSFANVKKDKASFLPPATITLIQWEEVKPWVMGQRGIKAYTVWISNDICKSPKAFALKARPSMHAHFFSPTATLLIDPTASIEDGSIVLVFLNDSNKEPVLRLLTFDGEEKWLNPLKQGKPETTMVLTAEHLVVGPIVEVRYSPGIK